MTEPVAIVGIGLTSFESAKSGQAYGDMIQEATAKALADAHLQRDQVPSVVLAASDLIDGRGISSMVFASAAGAMLKDEIKVAEDSAAGLTIGYLRLTSELFDVSIVAGWSKSSESPLTLVQNLAYEPFYHRQLGMDDLAPAALQAARYCHITGCSPDAAAAVVVKNRRNGAENPRAHIRQAITAAEVRDSPPVWWPLRRAEVRTESDGACVLVLARGNRARELSDRPVWIKGLGWETDGYNLGERDLARFSALAGAARRAYAMAGINDPLHELDLAEVHDFTAYNELMAYEALGFCGPGEGARLAIDGVTDRQGTLPVNPSGGVLCTNPYASAGLLRIAEAALQLRGEAGGCQIPGARRALAHGMTGLGGQSHTVVILEGDKEKAR